MAVQPTAGANRYTRVGNLKFDAVGNLTDGGGSKVMGIPLDADGNPILDANGTLEIADLQAINVPPAELEKYTGITIGKSGEITGIKAGDPEFTPTSMPDWLSSVKLPEGSNYTGDVQLAVGKMVYTDPTKPAAVAAVTLDPTANITKGPLTLSRNAAGDYKLKTGLLDKQAVALDDPPGYYGDPVLKNGILSFPNLPGLKIDTTKLPKDPVVVTDFDFGSIIEEATSSVLVRVYNEGGVIENLRSPAPYVAPDPPLDPTIELENKATGGTIKLVVDPAKLKIAYNASATTMTKATIGTIEAGSDKPVTLGYLAIAKFANNDGLLQDGNGYFMESANSGAAIASKAGTNGTGGTESANLEMSNVDLSQEFTDMIVAQRGFQANSRIITVSDSILEELINLKR
ncbi:MAG: flagellar hook-basal body complex protein [Acetobacterium sp.]|nr:flagellar hook-basal body complex protein [Acetobacterium sp.]